LGESASPAAVRRITAALESEPSVERVIHLRTMHLGPDELLVGAKIAVRHDQTAAGWPRRSTPPRRACGPRNPRPVIYLEPDLDRTPGL